MRQVFAKLHQTTDAAGSVWFALADVKNAHPHRFRDTFAVELLLAGTPIHQVSVLLGHSNIKVTEKHHSP